MQICGKECEAAPDSYNSYPAGVEDSMPASTLLT
jgi:hypothetical protein